MSICTHDPEMDEQVSASINNNKAWETRISILLGRWLSESSSSSPNSNIPPNCSVLLDIGSHIGSHALYAAALGHHVWAVDALTTNHVKVYKQG